MKEKIVCLAVSDLIKAHYGKKQGCPMAIHGDLVMRGNVLIVIKSIKSASVSVAWNVKSCFRANNGLWQGCRI